VAKGAPEGCLMLITATEWPGTQYPWWAALCALFPKRWQLPQDRPLYRRGATDLMPSRKWRTWAFLLDSREGSQAQAPLPPAPPPIIFVGPSIAGGTTGPDPGALLMAAHRHMDTLPLGSRPGKLEPIRDVQRFDPAGAHGCAPA